MEQTEEDRKRTKLKKQESFREVQESIQKFEIKKEFVQVKLQTRQSFREDQEALNRRFNRRTSGKMQGDSEENGTNDHDSIKLDLSSESEDKGQDSSEHKHEGHVNNGYISESPDLNPVRADTNERVAIGIVENELHETKVFTNKTDSDNTHVPNGHLRGSMTPEPRLKAKGRLYEKNDKLAASNSNHLDRISLKGGKPAHHTINGFSPAPVIMQEARDPHLPAADVSGIPRDGSLRDFSVQQMVTIFRLLNVREDVVHRLFKSNIDGKRFSLFTDKDLKTLGILNPVVCYFRDRSVQQVKKSQKFML